MRTFALSRQLLQRICWSSAVLVTAVTGVAFFATMQQATQQQIDQMAEAAMQRVSAGRSIFMEAEATTATYARMFLERYPSRVTDPEYLTRYQQWTDETSPGVRRLQSRFHQGTRIGEQQWQAISGFIGPWPQPRDAELQARIMIALELLNQLGPAWEHQYANTHVTFPENVLLNYWRESAWGLLARADLDITAYAVVASTLQQNNPARLPNWTGLYFDESARSWVITYQRPVDWQGKHLITPSHDVYLADVIATMLAPAHQEAEYYLFNQQQQLVAGPLRYTENNEYIGLIDVNKPGLQELAQIYREVMQNAPNSRQPQQFFTSPAGDQLLVATWVEGPDWWHVTAYPQAQIRAHALQASLWVAGLGAGLLVMVLVLVWLFVRQHISVPLQQLHQASTAIASGHYQAVSGGELPLPLQQHNEIGALAKTLVNMASRISGEQEMLEREVSRRTAELQVLNDKLARMAHLDGLTGLFNRRALDGDIEALCQQAPSHAVALLLMDVDHFKHYNDRYGHEQGDQALQAMAQALVASLDAGRVYRYGGEELAVLIPAYDYQHALQLGEQARQAVTDLQLEHLDSACLVLTISVGVTLYSVGDQPADLLRRADKALYQAKAAGRHCVIGN